MEINVFMCLNVLYAEVLTPEREWWLSARIKSENKGSVSSCWLKYFSGDDEVIRTRTSSWWQEMSESDDNMNQYYPSRWSQTWQSLWGLSQCFLPPSQMVHFYCWESWVVTKPVRLTWLTWEKDPSASEQSGRQYPPGSLGTWSVAPLKPMQALSS